MTHGIKVSKVGQDVKTEADIDLAFHSGYGALKLYSSGTIQITTNGSGNGTASATHGMGYAPAFYVFRKDTANNNLMSGVTDYPNAYFPIGSPNLYVKNDVLHHAIHAYADSTKIYVQVSGGKASTTFNFVYFLLVDQSEDFSSADGITTDSYGFKISKAGFDVKTAKEYQLALSSQYKILQYYDVSKKTSSIDFDEIFSSIVDTSVQQASYIDINHGLGYQPFFLAYFSFDSDVNNRLTKIPYSETNAIDIFNLGVSGFCDSTRVRIYCYRNSTNYLGTNLDTWPDDTFNLYITVFTEDLSNA